MNYYIYKMRFDTGVHFGDETLNSAEIGFCADRLFSALFMEALESDVEAADVFLDAVKQGEVLFSDAMPFAEDVCYVPKPLCKTDTGSDEIRKRKKWKKIEYIPMDSVSQYVQGNLAISDQKFVKWETRQQAGISHRDQAEPYAVDVCRFIRGAGLYILLCAKTDDQTEMILKLLDGVGFSGIGGRKSTGLGKYYGEFESFSGDMFERDSNRYLLLTTSLPQDDELEGVIDNSNIVWKKRSGFIQSGNYADGFVKKQTQFFIRSGSIVCTRYQGDVYNVGTRGNHPVWRYGKPVFLSI